MDLEANEAGVTVLAKASKNLTDRPTNSYTKEPLHAEAGSNTSTVTLRVVGGDEEGTPCLGVQLGHHVPGGYKYGDLALQVGGVSNLRQLNIYESRGNRTQE
jgi:hypothetical protein